MKKIPLLPVLSNFQLLTFGKIVIMLFVASISVNLKLQAQQPGNIDLTFDPGSGPNGLIFKTAIQSDGKIIIQGNFNQYDGTPRNTIARINQDGSLDLGFNPGALFSSSITAFAIQSDGKIILAGFNNPGIARVNKDGSLDSTFVPGTGPNATVAAINIQPDGKIIITGAFNSYNGLPAVTIARLNSDGSLDTGFNSGTGVDSIYGIYSVALQKDGKIIIAGSFSKYNGINRNALARINADGSLDSSFNPGSGSPPGFIIYKSIIQPDGKIIIGGNLILYNGSYIARIKSDGSPDSSFKVASSAIPQIVYDIALQNDGKIVVAGPIPLFLRLNTDGSVDQAFNGMPIYGSTLYSVVIQNDGKIIIGGLFTNYKGTSRNNIARVWSSPTKGVTGAFFNDINSNCIKEANEQQLAGKVTINPGNIVVQAGINENWFIDSLAAGTYTISADTSGPWKRTCPVSQSFTVVYTDSLTIAPYFGFVSTQPCSDPQVSVHAPFLRPCFSNQSIFVTACNQNVATAALNNGYVILNLDPWIIPTSSALPFTNLGNNSYRVDVGNINPGQCINFTVLCSLSCSAIVNKTICIEAVIYPQDSCSIDTSAKPFPIGVAPCTLPWDKSSLSVTGQCVNNTIRFVIYNTGSPANGNMKCYAPVRVYVDGVLFQLDSIMLAGGDSAVYTFPADGRTWHLEADQHPLHPGTSHPNASVEACGNLSNWTPGLINLFAPDDAEPANDIYCGLVTSSMDPNDKTGFPVGPGSNHYIYSNQDIEYLIRFQNTGNDTAFNIIIRDTLEAGFDIFSVVPGASSHDYSFRMYGPRVLEWTFNNILLPDSNVDEPGSHGFVVFRVKQNPNLSNGTQLTNSADIYFDFNAPVITNKTLHTVNDMIQVVPVSVKNTQLPGNEISVFPNPARNLAILNFPRIIDNGHVDLYNLQGQLVMRKSSLHGNSVMLELKDLSEGIYFIKVMDDSGVFMARVIRN